MRKSAILGANGREKPNVWRGGAKSPSQRQRFAVKREARRGLQERLQIPHEESEEHQLELEMIRNTPVPRTLSGRLANV